MFAISETAGRSVGAFSGDQSRNWWDGKQWTPASDRAKTFENRAEAELHAEEHCTRDYVVVDFSVSYSCLDN